MKFAKKLQEELEVGWNGQCLGEQLDDGVDGVSQPLGVEWSKCHLVSRDGLIGYMDT